MKKKKKILFAPFYDEDFLVGNGSVKYLNEIIWLLIEDIRNLEKRIEKLEKK